MTHTVGHMVSNTKDCLPVEKPVDEMLPKKWPTDPQQLADKWLTVGQQIVSISM